MSLITHLLTAPSLPRPIHITLTDPHPSLRSLYHTLEDPYYSNHPHSPHTHHHSVSAPSFDVRESETAFYLEGEFPGVGAKDDILIEELGSRTLLVECRVSRWNLEDEWAERGERSDPRDEELSDTGIRDEEEGRRSASRDREREQEGRERRDRKAAKDAERDEKGLRIRLAERHTGYLQRSFTFPSPVELGSLRARLRDGLLVLRVPKVVGTGRREERKRIGIED